jgi:hypothetical protein
MKKLFTLLFVALMAVAAQAQTNVPNCQVVLVTADGTETPYDLIPGWNTDPVNTFDLTWDNGFIEVANFYFLIDGVNYGAPGDEPVFIDEAMMGYGDQTPLVADSKNTYIVGNGYSYNLGVHPVLNDDYEIVAFMAYVAKGGPVSVDELAAKTVANVRYFNMAGQEIQEANGVTIQVTTYTDGTTNAVKVIK